MLIVEGTDLVGKTTLCKKIVDDLNARSDVPYRPYVYRHFTRLPEYWDYYWDYLPHIDVGVVMDRFHLSAQAYGRAIDGGEHINPTNMRLLRAQLALRCSFVVLVLAKESLIRERHAKREADEMFSVQQVIEANCRFQDADIAELADYRTWCTPAYPWVSDNVRKQIVETYVSRLNSFSAVMMRRSTRP